MSIEDMIDAVTSKDFNTAGEAFKQELNTRITDAIEAKRVEVGSQMSFSPEELDVEDVEPEIESDDID